MASTPFARTPKALELPAQTTQLLPTHAGNVASAASDIRGAFSSFLATYSQKVVLQRLNLQIHCTHCWSEINGEGDPLCAWCLGRGYESTFEIHRSRRMSSLNEHRQQLTVQSSPGAELVDEVFWFFDWDVNVQEEDTVYEVTWLDPAQTVVDRLLMPFQVTYSVPFRGVNGRIEFWRASGLGKPIDRAITGQHLQTALATALNQKLHTVIYGPPADVDLAPSGGHTNGAGSYTFTQIQPSMLWTIVHELGRNPSVVITDSSGEQVVGSYSYPDLNTVVCTFSAPFAGQAYLS